MIVLVKTIVSDKGGKVFNVTMQGQSVVLNQFN
jgi:hypothetical protein